MAKKSDPECCGTTGPTTCPLDLQSDMATLPSQSSRTNGESPKMDSMMDMIEARSGKPGDDMSGMTSPDTKSRSFS